MERHVVTALFALSLLGCTTIEGNGEAASEVRAVPVFDGIANELPMDLEVEVADGARPEVTVSCDENLLPYIHTRLDGTVLRFETDDFVAITPLAPCHATVRTSRLVEVACSGSGIVAARGALDGLRRLRSSGSGGVSLLDPFTSDRLDIAQSGSGEVIVAGLEGRALDVDSSSSGVVELNGGRVSEAHIDISGSGLVLATPLEVESAVVRSSGSGRVELTVLDYLHATLSGSGDVIVEGDPEVHDRASGSGRVIVR